MEQTIHAEVRNGQLYVTRHIGPAPLLLTKWDLLSTEEKVQYTKTAFGFECTNCDELLVTEADFAKHFVIDNVQHFNLGHCPREKK